MPPEVLKTTARALRDHFKDGGSAPDSIDQVVRHRTDRANQRLLKRLRELRSALEELRGTPRGHRLEDTG
jgi:hypothetical protein